MGIIVPPDETEGAGGDKISMNDIRAGLEHEVRDFLPYVKNKCPLFVKTSKLNTDERLCIFLTNIILRLAGKNKVELPILFDIIKKKLDIQEVSLRERGKFSMTDKDVEKKVEEIVRKL